MGIRTQAVKAAYALAVGLLVATVVSVWQDVLGGAPISQIQVGRDFATFHGAALLVAEGHGAAMYEPTVLGARIAESAGYTNYTTQAYGHPPFFAVLFLPLTQLPFAIAYLGFVVVSGIALAVAISRVGLERLGPAMGLIVLSVPGFWTIQLGQMGMLVSALLLAVFLSLRSGHRFVAGLLLGLLAFKPLYAFGIGVWWLLKARRYALAIAGAAFSAAAMVVLGFAVPDGWSAYRSLVSDSGGSFVADVATSGFSILEMWLAMIPVASVAIVLWLTTLGGVIAAFSQVLKRLGNSLEPSFALAVVVGLLLAPRTAWYDWVVLVVPAVLLWGAYPGLRAQVVVAGAWLFPVAALSWTVASRLEHMAGSFVQVAPVALAVVTWWWFRQALQQPSETLEPTALA